MDALCSRLLRQLGYGEGVQIFEDFTEGYHVDEQLEIEEYIIEGDDYIARMELPTEPTPNELIQIIDYLDNHADSYVDLYNKGPFVVAAGISFVVDDEGTKVAGKPYELPAPLLLVTEENGQAVIDLVDELYSAEDYAGQFPVRTLN